jgi:hypothetical protein
MSNPCSHAIAGISSVNKASLNAASLLDFSVSNTWLDLLAGHSPRASLLVRKSMRRISGIKYHANHPEVARARQLWRLGMSEGEIASELQVGMKKIERWLKLGLLDEGARAPKRAASPVADSGARS